MNAIGQTTHPAHSRGQIVVIEDDPMSRRILCGWLGQFGYDVVEYESGSRALACPVDDPVAVCLDLALGDVSGLDVLQRLRAVDADLPVIVVTATGDVATAVRAMRAGAYDYLVKPLERDQFGIAIARAAERRALTQRVQRLSDRLGERDALAALVGDSPAMRELKDRVRRIASSDIAICIQGESGTGKELVARACHDAGRRADGPFVAVNCAAIPDGLLESELFGHERGAFTGATSARRGRFEQASGGTLFLDEIGELSPASQAGILRTLQERTIRRVGGSAEIPVDVRIVCATHRDLRAEVEAGRFRDDLFFRVVVYPIQVPPLRARAGDIPALVTCFLDRFTRDVGRRITGASTDALDALTRYAWPGNVRELENTIHRAMLSATGEKIALSDIPAGIRARIDAAPQSPDGARAADSPAPFVGGEARVIPLRELESLAIAHALRATDGCVSKAARLLGIGRATLYRRLAAGAVPVDR